MMKGCEMLQERHQAIASQFPNLYGLGVTRDEYPRHPVRL
jgi:hypothetical protein